MVEYPKPLYQETNRSGWSVFGYHDTLCLVSFRLSQPPVEDRWILIGKKEDKLWTAIYTFRGNAVRIISVRRSREKEVDLYERKIIRTE
jgi:uncharacterized DUF497 family protein